jgi:hypothetical protein
MISVFAKQKVRVKRSRAGEYFARPMFPSRVGIAVSQVQLDLVDHRMIGRLKAFRRTRGSTALFFNRLGSTI